MYNSVIDLHPYIHLKHVPLLERLSVLNHCNDRAGDSFMGPLWRLATLKCQFLINSDCRGELWPVQNASWLSPPIEVNFQSNLF